MVNVPVRALKKCLTRYFKFYFHCFSLEIGMHSMHVATAVTVDVFGHKK